MSGTQGRDRIDLHDENTWYGLCLIVPVGKLNMVIAGMKLGADHLHLLGATDYGTIKDLEWVFRKSVELPASVNQLLNTFWRPILHVMEM